MLCAGFGSPVRPAVVCVKRGGVFTTVEEIKEKRKEKKGEKGEIPGSHSRTRTSDHDTLSLKEYKHAN